MPIVWRHRTASPHPTPSEATPPRVAPPQSFARPRPNRWPRSGGSGASPPGLSSGPAPLAAMTTSPRPAHSCCSGGTQAGPRAPAWGPQLPPPPPPRLLPVPSPPRVSSPHSGPRPGSLPAAPSRADAEGEGAAMRSGAGDPLCEYRSRSQLPPPACAPASGVYSGALLSFTSLKAELPQNLLSPLNHPSGALTSVPWVTSHFKIQNTVPLQPRRALTVPTPTSALLALSQLPVWVSSDYVLTTSSSKALLALPLTFQWVGMVGLSFHSPSLRRSIPGPVSPRSPRGYISSQITAGRLFRTISQASD